MWKICGGEIPCIKVVVGVYHVYLIYSVSGVLCWIVFKFVV